MSRRRQLAGRTVRVGALALLAALACAVAPAAAASEPPRERPPILAPILGPPRASEGRVDWTPWPEPDAGPVPPAPPPADDTTATLAWLAGLEANPMLGTYALHAMAPLRLARGDTLGADSCWAALAAKPGVWQWEAVRGRCDLALARDDPGAADSILGATPGDWPELERSAWLMRHARVRAMRGDTVAAIAACRSVMQMDPSFPTAGRALDRLETLLGAWGTTPDANDELRAAAIERARGDRRAAIRRLQRAHAMQSPPRPETALALAAELRRARRRTDARHVLDHAFRGEAAHNPACLLERARLQRDAGRTTHAIEAYAAAAAADSGGSIAATAWWEAARAAESRGRMDEARAALATVAGLGGRHAGDAALRTGILWLADGRPDSARAWFERAGDEAGAFWTAVAIRAAARRTPGMRADGAVEAEADSAGPAAADSLLRALAARPGYAFYRAAARETLGVGGWPGTVAAGDCAPDSACRVLDRARALLAVGARDEAMLVMARWSAGDGAGDGDALLDASRIAYAAGRPRVAIRYALDAADAMSGARAWAVAPWAYPAAHDSLYMSVEVAPGDGLDRALLRAVTWQESRFDQEAVSRSNAIGLMQLKLPAATDVSRWRGERVPHEDDLTDPELNLRYGAHYLHAMLKRFDGNVAAALGAYNAGAGRVPDHWRTILDRGGEALLAEMMPFEETRTYVSRVLAARAAYRELRPFSAP